LIACAANIVPIALTLGLLSLWGVTMDLSVLCSTCVALGIVVDDSIHMLTKYKRLRAKGLDHDEANVEAMRDAGKAIVFTTTILVCAMGMYTLTDFVPNRNIGVGLSIMLIAGMLFDLTLLPALIKTFYKHRAPAPAAPAPRSA